MPDTFVSSDHHFFHDAVNDLCDRPFSSTDECAHEMIRLHNKFVRPDAKVIFLGDLWFGPRDGRFIECMRQMNGEKALIWGNHDRGSATATNGLWNQKAYFDAGFVGVADSGTLTLPQVKATKVPGGAQARKVLLSHFPYTADHKDKARHMQFRLRDEGMWLIHGHVHGLYTVKDRGVNVGVDVWDFKPVNVHDVALLIAQVEAGVREEF